MDEKHLLNVNPHKVIKCLEGILNAAELSKIQSAVSQNGLEIIELAECHIQFADAATGNGAWRQKVSRGYFACYTASRAVRLVVHGHYDTEVQDHKRIGDLPRDFPDHAVWADLLTKLRGDRNIVDYDHTSAEAALEMTAAAYLAKAKEFVEVVKAYFSGRGIQ